MRSAIQVSVAALLLSGCAQERRAAQDHPLRSREQTVSEVAPASRLESVTWNAVRHELTWVVSSGEKEAGADYKPLKSESYLIALDDATMSFNGEARRFSTEEASNVHVLMDLIAKYAIDSTVWWDDGHGEPVDDGSKAKDKSREETQDPGDVRTAVLRVSAGPSRIPIR
jgi:hypothetical protein